MDIVNERTSVAIAEIRKRADKLTELRKQAGKRRADSGFEEGAKILSDMIDNQIKLYDKLIFDAPKSALEQKRNLQLLTGGPGESVKHGIKETTEALDGMLEMLGSMIR